MGCQCTKPVNGGNSSKGGGGHSIEDRSSRYKTDSTTNQSSAVQMNDLSKPKMISGKTGHNIKNRINI